MGIFFLSLWEAEGQCLSSVAASGLGSGVDTAYQGVQNLWMPGVGASRGRAASLSQRVLWAEILA